MDETTMSIIAIMASAILMFVGPLILISERSDDISQLVVQTNTAEFVNEVIKTGKITSENYQRFVSGIHSSGNTYDIDIELKILDESLIKHSIDYSVAEVKKEGNTYYSLFTSQIEDKIGITSNTDYNVSGKLVLKQGDRISVTVKNSSKTLSQSLKNFYYNAKGEDLHIISASSAGTITVDGSI